MFQDSCSEVMVHTIGMVFTHRKRANFSLGTGTILNSDGIVLTANHVLRDTSWQMTVSRNFQGRLPECFHCTYELIRRFPEHDLALIRIPDIPLDDLKNPLNISFSRLDYGFPVGSFGHPFPEIASTSHATATFTDITIILRFKSYFVAGINHVSDSKCYVLDSFTYKGHSGGPVFEPEGNLVGVMTRGFRDKSNENAVAFCEASCLTNIQTELETL